MEKNMSEYYSDINDKKFKDMREAKGEEKKLKDINKKKIKVINN